MHARIIIPRCPGRAGDQGNKWIETVKERGEVVRSERLRTIINDHVDSVVRERDLLGDSDIYFISSLYFFSALLFLLRLFRSFLLVTGNELPLPRVISPLIESFGVSRIARAVLFRCRHSAFFASEIDEGTVGLMIIGRHRCLRWSVIESFFYDSTDTQSEFLLKLQ